MSVNRDKPSDLEIILSIYRDNPSRQTEGVEENIEEVIRKGELGNRCGSKAIGIGIQHLVMVVRIQTSISSIWCYHSFFKDYNKYKLMLVHE